MIVFERSDARNSNAFPVDAAKSVPSRLPSLWRERSRGQRYCVTFQRLQGLAFLCKRLHHSWAVDSTCKASRKRSRNGATFFPNRTGTTGARDSNASVKHLIAAGLYLQQAARSAQHEFGGEIKSSIDALAINWLVDR